MSKGRQRLEYIAHLVERWTLGQISTADYLHALQEIDTDPKKPLDTSSDIS